MAIILFGGCGKSADPTGANTHATSVYLDDSDPASDKSVEVFNARTLRDEAAQPEATLGGDSGDGTIWTIMLETFTDENHAASAEAVRRGMVAELPALAESRVEASARGSMIVFGRFESADDPQAKAELQRVKQMQFHGAKVFRKAMLTRVEDRSSGSPIKGNDLRSLRVRYPRVDPLYTLQVAAFASSKEDPLTAEERHRKAEGHAMMLRTQGYDAYFHHDDARGISVVTIGAFDHNAYDPLSTLYSAEVEMLFKKFPKHLVNGEEELVPLDPKRPKSRKVPMTPKLVQVPR